MEVLIPPELVSQGSFESGPRRFSQVERGCSIKPCSGSHLVVPVCILSRSVELLEPHPSISSINDG